MENIFEEIIDGNFPNLKDTGFKIQEAQRAPNKLNPNRPTPRHIIIKMAIFRDEERIRKAAREKQNVPYKGTPIRISFKIEGEIKGFSNKQKLKEYNNTKPRLKEILKGLL